MSPRSRTVKPPAAREGSEDDDDGPDREKSKDRDNDRSDADRLKQEDD